jgi:hypothetical protein
LIASFADIVLSEEKLLNRGVVTGYSYGNWQLATGYGNWRPAIGV